MLIRLPLLGLLLISLLSLTVLGQENKDERRAEPARTDKPREAREVRDSGQLDRDINVDRSPDRQPADFVPQNDRERALFEMIRQLRAEVSGLRRQLEQTQSQRDGQLSRDGRGRLDVSRDQRASGEREMTRRENDAPRDGEGNARRSAEVRRDGVSADQDQVMQKTKRIFAAYDKNQDRSVSFEEWLAMREGEMTSERRAREQQHFSEPAGDDQKITIEEFYLWTLRRSGGTDRAGSVKREGVIKREGDSGRVGNAERAQSRDRNANTDRSPETAREIRSE